MRQTEGEMKREMGGRDLDLQKERQRRKRVRGRTGRRRPKT